MKYIKAYEGYGYKWENIVEKDGKLYIYLYKLAYEMETYANNEIENKKFRRGNYSVPSDKLIVRTMETEYCDLVKKLLNNKVISFPGHEDNINFGICDNIKFHFSGHAEGFSINNIEEDIFIFNIEYISIKLDNMYCAENIIDGFDEMIVHLDINPEIYKNSSKYNI